VIGAQTGEKERTYYMMRAADNQNRLDNYTSQERDNLFKKYLDEIIVMKGISTNTEKAYQIAYDKFSAVGHPTDNQTATDAIIALRKSGLSESSVNQYIRCYKAFLNWMLDREDISIAPKMKILPVPKKIKLVFTQDQALSILKARPKKIQMIRIQALFAVACSTGLRFGELCSIRRQDIDARSMLVRVVGKVGERRVPICIEGLRWLNKIASTHSHEHIFATKFGSSLSHQNAQRELKRLFELAGVDADLAEFHNVRRFALRSYVAVAGMRAGQLLAGHSNLRTLEIYLDNASELAALPHSRISPLAQLSSRRR
jgi:site-specific recombinase XerC